MDHPPTSLTLIERLKAAEPDAWDFAVRLYGPVARGWCARLGVRGADVEDLTQELFRAAVTGLATFRRDRPGDSFRGWLYGITRNLVHKHFAKVSSAPTADGGTDAQRRLNEVPVEEPSDEEVESDRQILLRQALELVRADFEEKTWRAFQMTVLEGRLPDEVAPLLGVSAAAVRKYKSRVLHRLKSQLADVLE
jgi:RNA polymerase sigma-70 factor (ECF subfamily)